MGMADYMKEVGNVPQELSVEERNLLSVAYKNAVGSRRAAWRIITSIEQKEKSKGNTQNAEYCHEYVGKVEKELDTICNTILTLLNGNLLEKASSDEAIRSSTTRRRPIIIVTWLNSRMA